MLRVSDSVLTHSSCTSSNTPAQPPNDICENAVFITPVLDESVVASGTTMNATITSFPCTQGGLYSNNPSVFYSFRGTGGRVRLSTCSAETNFDAIILVDDNPSSICGSGNPFCTPLVSIEDFECGLVSNGTTASSVELVTVFDQLYEVAVVGQFAGETGNFGLTFLEYRPPANDKCERSIRISPTTDSETLAAEGNTLNATKGEFPCTQGALYQESKVIYYDFLGRGGKVRLSTCANETNFDTVILVDDSPDALCGAGEPFCNPLVAADVLDVCESSAGGTSLEFFTTLGQLYEVAIGGRSAIDVGNFGLKFLEYVLPTNDECEGAIRLVNGTEVFGSTLNATHTVFPCTQGELYDGTPGVFFDFVGTGGRVTLTTCSVFTNFQTTILVDESANTICGSGNPFCVPVVSSQGICESTDVATSIVELDTVAGQVYEVAVVGRSVIDVGNFGLLLDAGTAPELSNFSSPESTLTPEVGNVTSAPTPAFVPVDFSSPAPTVASSSYEPTPYPFASSGAVPRLDSSCLSEVSIAMGVLCIFLHL